jgi:hypothetical protein
LQHLAVERLLARVHVDPGDDLGLGREIFRDLGLEAAKDERADDALRGARASPRRRDARSGARSAAERSELPRKPGMRKSKMRPELGEAVLERRAGERKRWSASIVAARARPSVGVLDVLRLVEDDGAEQSTCLSRSSSASRRMSE